MNREEQIKQYCADQGFPYGACSGVSSVKAIVATEAIKWADKTMIERACKWLLNIDYDDLRYRDFCEEFNEELFVNDFRKAMEE